MGGKGSPDYTKAVRIMGVDAEGNPVTVLLDGAGRLLGILQGKHGDDYLPIQTDEVGRMLARIIDSDIGWGPANTIGNAELAVRLGGSSFYERRGVTLFKDDFSHGWGGWIPGAVGAGAAHGISATSWRTAGYSAFLTCPTDGFYTAYMYHLEYPLHPKTNMGFEFTFALDAGLLGFDMVFFINDGTDNYHFGMTYVNDEGLINAWATVKLVVDVANGEYLRMYFLDEIFDMTGFAPAVDPDVGPPALIDMGIVAYGIAASNQTFRVDNTILTTQEPDNDF